MKEMYAQIRALGETELWNFVKDAIEKEYNIRIDLLRVEVGFKGEYDNVKEICLNSCTKVNENN